ncbi:MAG: peptidoglycan editing factor PgeF [Rickettsiella sp.]|nr:peptidoglycan editing factor PgeF [Rickettsiella sp.]
MLKLIIPEWPAPCWIKAATTTRHGGFSNHPFDSLNLGLYVGDNVNNVAQNHQLLKDSLGLKQDPLWLKQVHGTRIIAANTSFGPVADAIYSCEPHVVCAVQTADCLPLLICSRTRYCVAAIHAGWKGLAAGIIENSIKTLDCPINDLLVWLGPAIGPQAFVVGEEVIAAFIEKDSKAQKFFKRLDNKHWFANLYSLAKQQLKDLGIGINAIYGGKYCTYTNKEQFFSFRRDRITGRMASLIWISNSS